MKIPEKPFDEFGADDTEALDDILTRGYELGELEMFFKNCNANESFIEHTTLMFDDVNQYFPVEVIRTNGYSVYRVNQGGYFYVFWVKTFDPDRILTDGKLAVYFTVYLPSSPEQRSFESLKIGSSTARDVRAIDPSFELSFLLSTGVYSYSLLDNNNIMEIKYGYQDNFHSYDDLIVMEKRIIPRNTSSSKFSLILAKDLP